MELICMSLLVNNEGCVNHDLRMSPLYLHKEPCCAVTVAQNGQTSRERERETFMFHVFYMQHYVSRKNESLEGRQRKKKEADAEESMESEKKTEHQKRGNVKVSSWNYAMET